MEDSSRKDAPTVPVSVHSVNFSFLFGNIQYMHKLGMSQSWSFSDVFGLDPVSLATVPQPTVALILLFPETENVSH